MKSQKPEKELLVALLPKTEALDRLKTEGWYHIPVETAPKRWPPKVMAFYQGRVFGIEERYQIRYFGEVENIEIVLRKVLFPNDEENEYKAEEPYYRVQLKSLQEREVPIVSYRPRRLVFIPTTLWKFELAEQINDLFDGSPLEDKLWKELKSIEVTAERQWRIVVQGNKKYYLDFAVFCQTGKLAIETDGYTTHYDSLNQIDYDTWRRNEIALDNWHFLHYTTNQIKDERTPYLAQIQKEIEQLGGLESPESFTLKIGEERAQYIINGEEPF
jgi:very-short-patch-repair endonuclease